MVRKIIFWLIWVGLIVYAFLFAPPDQPETPTLIRNLSTGQWQGINPAIVALFNVMGVWPMIYSCLLLLDGKMQKVRAWPFVLASFAVGAFALLPYLALREPNSTFSGSLSLLLKLLNSRWTGIFLTIITVGLLAYGFLAGDWRDFAQQWQTNRFIHVMSLDFCLLCLLFPTVLGDDMARRGLNQAAVFWAVTLLPLLGPVLYLSLRPPVTTSGLRDDELQVASNTLS